MSEKGKDFYVWTMESCIKATYIFWGTDMMSMYNEIKKEFPNAIVAINKMYEKLKTKKIREREYYKAKPVTFKRVRYVYQALENLIPQHKELKFNVITKEQAKEYKTLNILSWDRFESIMRIDLIMAVLLFTEEFILEPIKSDAVNFTDNQLTVEGTFVKLEVSKRKDKTHISILIRDVILLEYVVLN